MRNLIIILGVFLLLTSCCRVKVVRSEENIIDDRYKRTLVFLSYSGDTIIKCKINEDPKFNCIKRVVSVDSKSYYVKLDSLEYLDIYVVSDATSTVTWQIRRKQ